MKDRSRRRRSGSDPGRRVRAAWSLPVWALFAAPAVALAQDDPPPPPPPAPRGTGTAPVPVDPASKDFRGAMLGDLFTGKDVGDERVITAVGGTSQPVWIKLDGLELRCDSVVLWGDKAKLEDALRRRRPEGSPQAGSVLGPVLRSVYAEGHVYVRRDSHTIHAERVFIDFAQNRAYIVDARVQGTHAVRKGAEAPLVLRAAVVRGVARDRFVAEDASLTTCTYDHPHLEFTSDRVEVDFSDGRQRFDTALGTTVRVDTPVADSLPVFVLPRLGGDLGSYPLQTVEIGSSSRMGFEFGIGVGGRLRRDDGSTWGDWKLVPRWRSDRGAGVEAEIEHDSEPVRAGGPSDRLTFGGSYQSDGADEDHFSERGFDGEVDGDTPNSRGNFRAEWRHHLENGPLSDVFGHGWRLDGELSWYSDRGYIPEYDKDAATEEKQQETFLELRKSWGVSALSVLGSTRLNDEAVALTRRESDLYLTDYENQTESLPAAAWHLVNLPVVPFDATNLFPVNLSVQAGVASIDRRWDDEAADAIEAASGWEHERVLRGDLEGRVTLPFQVGPVQVTPAFGGSLLYADEANGYANAGSPDADDSEVRGAGFYAIRVGTEAHRRFHASSGLFDLNGLRHVISPEVQWFHRFQVDEDPGTFQTNDLVDELVEQNVVSFRLRNRLQTQREGALVDWIDYEMRFLYYVDPTDATGGSFLGLREDFSQPLQRLDFAGEDKYLRADRDGSAFHQHRVRFQVRPDLWLLGEADYDMQRNHLETSGVGARWFATKRFSVYVGRRAIDDDSSIWTFRGDYTLSDKWAFAGEFQEDTDNDRGLRTRLALFRRSHDLTIAVEFESERLLDEVNFALALYPHDWLAGKHDPFSRRPPLDYDALRWYR